MFVGGGGVRVDRGEYGVIFLCLMFFSIGIVGRDCSFCSGFLGWKCYGVLMLCVVFRCFKYKGLMYCLGCVWVGRGGLVLLIFVL